MKWESSAWPLALKHLCLIFKSFKVLPVVSVLTDPGHWPGDQHTPIIADASASEPTRFSLSSDVIGI